MRQNRSTCRCLGQLKQGAYRQRSHIIHPSSTESHSPVQTAVGIQIQSAVLPQYTLRTDRQTNRQTDRPTNRWAIGDRSVPNPLTIYILTIATQLIMYMLFCRTSTFCRLLVMAALYFVTNK